MSNSKTLNTIAGIAIPAIGETVIYTVISMFDVMFIGRFGGSNAVSAIGLPNEVWNTFVNIFIVFGISISVTSYVARANGSGNYKGAEEYSFAGIIIGLMVSIVITYVLYNFAHFILKEGGQSGAILDVGIKYIKLGSLAIFLNMINSVISSIFRGYGDTYTPFLGSCILFLLNIFLDYFFIYGKIGLPRLGVYGVAFAKNAAYFIEFIFLAFLLIKRRLLKVKGILIFNKIIDIVVLAIPAALEEGAFSISRLISSFMLMKVGTIFYVANQIANTVESISFMPIGGLGIAATTLVGIKVGNGKIKEAKKYAKICTFVGICIMLFFSAIFLVMPGILIRNFIDSKEYILIELTAACLKIGALEQPFFAISIILASALKGSGNTKDPFYISLFTSWAIRIPLIYYFISLKGYPVTAVWWITSLQWGVDAVITYLVFSKKFRNSKGVSR